MYNNSYSLEYKYDLAADQLVELPVTFPDSYVGKVQNFYSIVPSRAIGKNGVLVFSWPNEPAIYVHNIKNFDVPIKKTAHIPSFGKLMNGTSNKRSERLQLAFALDHALYTKILFDPFRNVYYRIASVPSGRYLDSDLDHWDAFGRNAVGVVMLDLEFNIIGFELLPPETYNCCRAFVGEEGLFLSKNNPFRPAFDENKLEYGILEMVNL